MVSRVRELRWLDSLSHILRPLVNGVALANRGKTVFCLGSDGSQQEGNDAEAARLAVAQHLNVKLLIDDNDVTIAGEDLLLLLDREPTLIRLFQDTRPSISRDTT